jgi:signal transduction histidine kinase
MQIIAKFDNLFNRLNKHGEEYGFPCIIYGYYELANYFGYFTTWYFTHKAHEPFPAVFWHIFAPFLCLGLVLKKYWPDNTKRFYTLFWYFTVMCTQISFITYGAFESYEYTYIAIDLMLAIFILCLILDWPSFAIIIPIGILVGLMAQYLSHGTILWHLNQDTFTHLLIPVIWTTGVGILFSRNASRYHQNLLLQRKLAAIRTVANMAHELRNPLATIRIGSSGIRKCFATLMENYLLAQNSNLGGAKLTNNQLEGMERVFNNIDSEINFSNTMIDTLLANTKEMAMQPTTSSSNQISTCIQAAINRYPFASNEQRQLVHLDLKQDFTYQGDDLMVTHVFFNLLKNAIQVINEQGKGEIFISLDNNEKYNIVYFKDTAKGMSTETQAKIFQSFYTETKTGTGVGLAFCTMIMKGLHGKIEVKSELGVFTEFVLSFPKV